MTAWQLFAKEAENSGFDNEKTRTLYEVLENVIDPSAYGARRVIVELTTDEAIKASHLLSKFGACLTWDYCTSIREETHKYYVKMISKIE